MASEMRNMSILVLNFGSDRKGSAASTSTLGRSSRGPLRQTVISGLLMTFLAAGTWAQESRTASVTGAIDFAELAKTRVIGLPSLEVGDAAATAGKDKPAHGTSLLQLVQQGLSVDPLLQQAKAQQEALEAQRKVSRSELLPNFSLRHAQGPERSETTASGSSAASLDRHDYSVSTVRLTQPIYNRYLQHDHSAAVQAEGAAGMRYRSAQGTTILSVLKASVDVASAKLILEFSDAQLEQLQAILSYLENRAAAGASSQADLERARTRAYNARQTRVEQQVAYRNALFELERLTGQRPVAMELPSVQQLPVLNGGRQQLLDMGYANNADIQALARDVQAQQLRVDAELARYQPVLGVSLEHDTNRNIQAVTPRRHDSRALLVMTWGLSLGGKEWYQAQAASAELRQREARLRDEKLRLAQAIEADYSLLESGLLRIGAAQLEQASAARVVEAVAEQLRTGRLGSLLEALDASERHFGARQRLTQAIAQTIKSHAQLLQRTGQLDQDSVLLAALPATDAVPYDAGRRQ